jgi:hypothetical protein
LKNLTSHITFAGLKSIHAAKFFGCEECSYNGESLLFGGGIQEYYGGGCECGHRGAPRSYGCGYGYRWGDGWGVGGVGESEPVDHYREFGDGFMSDYKSDGIEEKEFFFIEQINDD